MMKKRYAVACLAVLISQFGLETSVEALEHEFVFAHMFPEGSLSGEIARDFSDRMADQIGARVTVVGGGQFGDERANIRQLVVGEIGFAMTGDLFIGTMLPQLQAMNLPFLTTSFEEAHTLHHTVVADALETALARFGILPLSRHCIGQRFLTANRPIAALSDLKGLKLRLPPDPVWTQAWAALGADVRNIPFPSLKNALVAGEVDAQENPPTLIRSAKLFEVQKYLIATRHYVQYQYILASRSALDVLDPDTRAYIRELATEVSAGGCEKAMLQQAEDLAWLTSEGGMTLLEYSAEGIRNDLLPMVDSLPVPQIDALRNHMLSQ